MLSLCYSINSIRSGLSGIRPSCVHRITVAGQAGTFRFNMTATLKSVGKKQCFRCLAWKPRSAFYAHPNNKDGLLGKCKECTKQDIRQHYADHKTDDEWMSQKREVRRNWSARTTRHLGERNPEVSRNYYQRNKHKFRARKLAWRAERNGTLVSPGVCEWCGITSPKLEKHHEDYSKPLDVIWLCHACHATTWRK